VDLLLLTGRLVLAGVFVTAAVLKVKDGRGFQRAVRDLGIPAALSGAVARGVPLVELVIGVALVPAASAQVAAICAVLLLLAFSAVILMNLARGRRPDCRCFGQLHPSPVGARSLLRNAALSAIAILVAWPGRELLQVSALPAEAGLSGLATAAVVAIVSLVVLVVLEGRLLLALWRQQGRILLRVDELAEQLSSSGDDSNGRGAAGGPSPGLAVGASAPDFELRDVEGHPVTLKALLARRRPVLLLFTDVACGPCRRLLPQTAGWQYQHSQSLTLAVISSGSPEAIRGMASEFGLSRVLVQDGHRVLEAYRCPGTPSAVTVDVDGRIATAIAVGGDSVRALVESSATSRLMPDPPAVGGAMRGHTHDGDLGGRARGDAPTLVREAAREAQTP
jgi:peroxiredoxin/uncharacterized membrane protein YphA (DoxX/SURF4 family)